MWPIIKLTFQIIISVHTKPTVHMCMVLNNYVACVWISEVFGQLFPAWRVSCHIMLSDGEAGHYCVSSGTNESASLTSWHACKLFFLCNFPNFNRTKDDKQHNRGAGGASAMTSTPLYLNVNTFNSEEGNIIQLFLSSNDLQSHWDDWQRDKMEHFDLSGQTREHIKLKGWH